MIAKIVLLLTVLAAVQAATLVSPGLLSAPIATRTSSVVAIPGAISTDSRISSAGILATSPLAWNHGVISPIGLSNAALLGYPGLTILK